MVGRWPLQLWRSIARATMVVGLVCAVAVWGFWSPVAIVIGIFVPVFLVSALLERGPWPSIRTGVRIASALVAYGGLLAVSEWSGAMLLLGLLVTSPLARIALTTGRLAAVVEDEMPLDGEPRDVAPVPAVDMAPAERVPGLDDEALCEAWRRSYVRLESCATADARHEVVRLRQVYLDELVSRHPSGTRRWLEAGARAAGNPRPFLDRQVHQRGSSGERPPHDGVGDAG
jgi:hypothetical protein